MSELFFTSDTHFNHVYVANLRGFSSTQEHDEAIVESWNSIVEPKDTVWHLGDVGMGSLKKFRDILEQLNGTIHLITGNHDECAPGVFRKGHNKQAEWLEVFKSVQAFQRFKYDGVEFLASHYPYEGEGEREGEARHTQYRLRNEGLPLVHGHTHSYTAWSDEYPLSAHVGWDSWERPVHVKTFVRWFNVYL